METLSGFLWVIFWVLLISGVIYGYLYLHKIWLSVPAKETAELKNKNDEKKSSTKDLEYNNKYGFIFNGKYWILASIGVVGLILTSGWIQIAFGIYIIGCVIGLVRGDK